MGREIIFQSLGPREVAFRRPKRPIFGIPASDLSALHALRPRKALPIIETTASVEPTAKITESKPKRAKSHKDPDAVSLTIKHLFPYRQEIPGFAANYFNNEEERERLKKRHNLDDQSVTQLADYVVRLLTGDILSKLDIQEKGIDPTLVLRKAVVALRKFAERKDAELRLVPTLAESQVNAATGTNPIAYLREND